MSWESHKYFSCPAALDANRAMDRFAKPWFYGAGRPVGWKSVIFTPLVAGSHHTSR